MPQFLRLIILALAMLSSQPLIAQTNNGTSKSGLIKGRLLNEATKQPVTDAQVAIPALKQLVITDAAGAFTLSRVPYGDYELVFSGQGIRMDTIRVAIGDAVNVLNDMLVSQNDASAQNLSTQIPVIALEDNNATTEDDGVRNANVSGLLTAARDPFISAAAFVLGAYRFQPRGYNRGAQEVQINGNPMNDVETGDAYWAQWGGLNDVFRSRSNTYGLQPSEYTFGGVNGSVYFDAAASGQRRQTRITYNLTNRSYRNRIMFTKSSGLMKNGWAYSVSLFKRWAAEGYVPGTFYDDYSYYAAVSRQLGGGRHEFNLMTFGAPVRRGKSAPVTQEAADISGDRFYNPAWGYQNGRKRNARVADNFLPTTLLNYEYRPDNTMRWETTVGYQFGKNKSSGLDYYNGANPYPDYYRNFPGYNLLNGTDPLAARFYTIRQIQWDELYNANAINYDSVANANGIAGNTVHGVRSTYALYNDVDDVHKFSFNTNLEKVLTPHFTLTSGIQVISQHTESYRQMLDLLGGDFYLNLNQFAVQQNVPNVSFNQYDLNTPNRVIREGDKYAYDYISRFTKGVIWAQGTFSYNKLDFFAAGRLGYNDFSREGLYRNGLFAGNSYGKSEVQRFTTYSGKAGVTYKLDGRNYLFVNALYTQEAPEIDNTFVSPRTRNLVVPGSAVPEKTMSVEGGYLMRAPKYNLRAVGYATDIKDATQIKRYYNDDPAFQSFVNYVMQGINTRNIGMELAAQMNLSSSFSATGVASVMQVFYTKNPSAVNVYRDNDTTTTALLRQVNIKNYYVAAGPQSAYTLGLNYRSKQFWNAGVNLNYLYRNYVDVSPDRRSTAAVEGVPVGSDLYHLILDQQKLPSAFTVDIFANTSILLTKWNRNLPRNTFLYLGGGISNLFDVSLRTGGFEQLRYDYANVSPDKFDNKYFYGSGRNFFINLSLKF